MEEVENVMSETADTLEEFADIQSIVGQTLGTQLDEVRVGWGRGWGGWGRGGRGRGKKKGNEVFVAVKLCRFYFLHTQDALDAELLSLQEQLPSIETELANAPVAEKNVNKHKKKIDLKEMAAWS